MGIFNNPWLVGIGTGIVSGLLVAWVLNLFLSKKRDREYRQQVSSANREVIYSIRSSIPEDALPRRETVEALINSTARRYGLDASELYQPKQISEELIKEVMDSSFLSSAKKSEYCDALIPLGAPQIPNAVKLLGVGALRCPDNENLSRFKALASEDELIASERSQAESATSVKRRSTRSTTYGEFIPAIFGILAAITSAAFSIKGAYPAIADKIESFGKHIGAGVFSIVFFFLLVELGVVFLKKTARSVLSYTQPDRSAKRIRDEEDP
jgi:hypothetical protein